MLVVGFVIISTYVEILYFLDYLRFYFTEVTYPAGDGGMLE